MPRREACRDVLIWSPGAGHLWLSRFLASRKLNCGNNMRLVITSQITELELVKPTDSFWKLPVVLYEIDVVRGCQQPCKS